MPRGLPRPRCRVCTRARLGADLRHRLDTATKAYEPPLAVVEMDAWDGNASDLLRRAAGCRSGSRPSRYGAGTSCATCSPATVLRCADAHVVRGALAGRHRRHRRCRRRLPDGGSWGALPAGPRRGPVVPGHDHGGRPGAARPGRRGVPAESAGDGPVCLLELDCSWRPFGGRVRIGGARCSPLHSPEALAGLACMVSDRSASVWSA